MCGYVFGGHPRKSMKRISFDYESKKKFKSMSSKETFIIEIKNNYLKNVIKRNGTTIDFKNMALLSGF